LALLGKEQRKAFATIKLWQGLISRCEQLAFFSGLIGIGGGIILSPVILLVGWGRMKETAAVSALFIFVNSVGRPYQVIRPEWIGDRPAIIRAWWP
jgi:uncharacterized membrane protein YfcA